MDLFRAFSSVSTEDAVEGLFLLLAPTVEDRYLAVVADRETLDDFGAASRSDLLTWGRPPEASGRPPWSGDNPSTGYSNPSGKTAGTTFRGMIGDGSVALVSLLAGLIEDSIAWFEPEVQNHVTIPNAKRASMPTRA